ncbi:14714_t:CDS:1 [Funneliformis caledonium]|uniref:14714_t:CDS:1 n=1 Tax=Funneliformis caledonium TaxID=1117310 RepID=A0A9N8VBE4_9GLOM|nr:14714_t:CDS:1 [Funneliformis caledonium]
MIKTPSIASSVQSPPLFTRILKSLFISPHKNEIKNNINQHKYKLYLVEKNHPNAKNLVLCRFICAVFDRLLKSNDITCNEGIKLGVDDILDLLQKESKTYDSDEQEEFAVWEVLNSSLLQLRRELWKDGKFV